MSNGDQPLADDNEQSNSGVGCDCRYLRKRLEGVGGVSITPWSKQNAPLVILEAMKMELTVRAPVSGKISSLACSVGQLVNVKDVLCRIEPTS